MKRLKMAIWTAACLSSLVGFAAAAAVPATKTIPAKPVPGIHLDQSQSVYFDLFSSSNYVLNLLQAKNKFNNHDVIIGGSVQGDFQKWHGNKIETAPPGVYDSGTGLYFTGATLDLMANTSPWSTVFVSAADSYIGRPGENGNYKYLPQGFIVFGNLDKWPLYLMAGISTIPFGVFTGSGGPWDSPLTANYFSPTQAPQVSLAYYKNGLSLTGAAYSDAVNHRNHFAYNFWYNKDYTKFSYSVGVGFLTDLQTDGTGNPANRVIRRRNIPTMNLGNILDFNASLTFGEFGITGEMVRGSGKVGVNSHKASGFGLTAAYTKKVWGKDTLFGISHSKSLHLKDVPASLSGFDAMLLAASGLKSAWGFGVSRAIFVDYITLGLDLEQQTTYTDKNTYTGTLDLVVYI